MKSKQIIYFIIFFLILNTSLALAASPYELRFNYNLNENSSIFLNEMHYTSSVLINILTPIETSCKWGYNNETIENDFDTNYGTNHEITFEKLEDGLHKYYVKCDTPNKTILEIVFKTKSKIYAIIQISQEPPLKKGNYEVNLITSTIPGETPKLEYSFDGVVYNPLPLSGAEQNWKTQIVIQKDVGKTLGSFRFQAKDLEGVVGTEIKQGKIFEIDTISPEIIANLEAIGHVGEIKLSWYSDGEDVEEYRIYKSENPGVDYTDFLDSTKEDYFIDTDVKSGKTYYYKITAVDSAKNEGRLSREIFATALLYGTNKTTGLSQNLLGKVDNSLIEIENLKKDIEEINNSLINKNEKEKRFFEYLDFNKEIEESISQLDSLKKDVTRYKLQDLTENELIKKINQAELKLSIIKKKLPESITIKEEYNVQKSISEEEIEKTLLEYGQEELTESQQSGTETLTKNMLEELDLKITSNAYLISINYLDGSSEEKTIIEEKINSSIKEDSKIKILLSIPKEIVEKTSEINFVQGSPEIIKSDPLLSFESTTKEITYILNKKIELKKIENIILLPIKIKEEKTKTSLTGFSIFKNNTFEGDKSLIIFAVLFIVLMGTYLILRKKNKYSKELIELRELIKKSKKKKLEKNNKELENLYEKTKELYKKLSKKEKKKIYRKIQQIYHEK